MRLFIGDDWAEDHHDVELMDASGRRLAKARLPEGVAGMARLHAMAGTGFAGATELLEQLVTQTGIEFRRLKRVMESAVALSLQQGAADAVTHAALSQALQEEGLEVLVDAATVQRLQEPATILAAKQVTGGPGRQVLEAELGQLATFAATQSQTWQTRSQELQARYEQCGHAKK